MAEAHLYGSGLTETDSRLVRVIDFLTSLRPAWHRDALCREFPSVDFYPSGPASLEPAKAVCARCAVRQECLQFALDDVDARYHGVWGGTSMRERRVMLSDARQQAA